MHNASKQQVDAKNVNVSLVSTASEPPAAVSSSSAAASEAASAPGQPVGHGLLGLCEDVSQLPGNHYH